MAKINTAVIGGGPMGLCCAYELLKKGHSVTLYETGDRLGGMSASFDFDGIDLERYYHFVCGPDQSLFDVLEEFDLKYKLKWEATQMGFFYDGHLYDWGAPQHLLTFPKLDIISKLRYGLMVMFIKNIDDWSALDKKEASNWIKKWVGQKAYDVLWKPLFELKFFKHADNLSAAWIATRIKRLGNSRKNLFEERLGFIEGGSKALIDTWHNRILDAGGSICLNTKVEKVCATDGKITGLEINGDFSAYEKIVTTIPIPYIPALVPDLSQDEKEKISAIDNIGVVCVVFKLQQALSKYFWINVNDQHMLTPGFIEYTNLRPMSSHIVYAPFYMPNDHKKHKNSDAQFIDEVKCYFKRINPSFQGNWIESAKVSRYHLAQPICPPGFYDSIPPMKTSLDGFFMADTCYHYPEDRSISESISVAKQLAKTVNDEL